MDSTCYLEPRFNCQIPRGAYLPHAVTQMQVIAAPPPAAKDTTIQGEVFQNISSPRALMAKAKSSGVSTALVQTGL